MVITKAQVTNHALSPGGAVNFLQEVLFLFFGDFVQGFEMCLFVVHRFLWMLMLWDNGLVTCKDLSLVLI